MEWTQEKLTSLAAACTTAFADGVQPTHETITPAMHDVLAWVADVATRPLIPSADGGAPACMNDLFDLVRSRHWHTHAVGPEGAAPDARCLFHNESLWEHSCGVMVTALARALELGYSEQHCRLAALTGLLHDIAKVVTVTVIRKKSTAYPMHGCIGAGALLQWLPPVPSGEWQALARAVAVHMCGYFNTDWDAPCPSTLWRLRLLHGEAPLTKQLLCALRPGDMSATVADAGREEDPWPSQEAFEAALHAASDPALPALRAQLGLRGTVLLVGGDGEALAVGDTPLMACLRGAGCAVTNDPAELAAALAEDRPVVLTGDIVYSSKMKDVLPAAARNALIVAIDAVPPAGQFGLGWLPERAMGRLDARITLQFFLRPRAAHKQDPVKSVAPHVRVQATPDATDTLTLWVGRHLGFQ